MNLEMVYSAPNMLRLQPNVISKERVEEYERFSKMIEDYIKTMKEKCAGVMGVENFGISLLYNGYVEPEHGVHFRKFNTFGFDYLYSDSGGLQVVTTRKKLDDALKGQIYNSQSVADFAFCFDKIPCEEQAPVKNSRSDNSTKYFYPDRIEECAIATAKDINAQINKFKELDSDAKVFYIVQGNTIKDMVSWVKYGWPYIDDKDRICGFAMADTCMGNSTLESIDMLIAYAIIFDITGRRYNRVHLLGVGSASRLMPVLSFIHSGIISKDAIVSFDSSSLSLSLLYGRVMRDKELRAISTPEQFDETFAPLAKELYEHIVKYVPDCDWEELREHLRKTFRSISQIQSYTSPSTPMLEAARVMVPLICLSQVYELCQMIVETFNTKNNKTLAFSNCQTIKEALDIRNAIVSSLPSKRIARFSSTLQGLFQ